MPMPQATIFSQYIGQYNRGLINEFELNQALNSMQLAAGPGETVTFPLYWTGGRKLLLEPRFISTADGAIAFRIHFVDYL